MKKRIKHLLLHQDHMAFQSIVPVVVIIVLLAGVLTALLLNTAGLKERLRQNTVSYADDVSAQLASNISSRMQMREDLYQQSGGHLFQNAGVLAYRGTAGPQGGVSGDG